MGRLAPAARAGLPRFIFTGKIPVDKLWITLVGYWGKICGARPGGPL